MSSVPNTDYTAKDMTGAIFRNQSKKEGDRRPNATGHATINGKKIKISAWTREGKSGKYQSLTFQWFDDAEGGVTAVHLDDPSDAIPF
jgi:hypothetical protein